MPRGPGPRPRPQPPDDARGHPVPGEGQPPRALERRPLRRPGHALPQPGLEAPRPEGPGDRAAPLSPRPPGAEAAGGDRPLVKIAYQAISDVGRKRKGNEDSLFLNPEQKLFVVADGMGGHAAGEVASKVAVDAINEFVCLTSGDEEITWPFGLDESISYDGNRLKTAIRHANRKVLEATREKTEYEGMATTVAAVLVDGDVANLGHVGDSRIYLFSDGVFTQLTSDHSWVNEQIQSGVISPDQARSHPLRNVVTRALGGKADLAVDMQTRRMKAGDLLLLCSDGLTAMVPDEDIARILGEAKGDVEKAAKDLVAEANANGEEDNITVVPLKFEE
ncbi:MAG: Stp1/IreP family PP2C-type Ser/Thr phosphatase [Acidobacteria bacterium]|nr:MAG: Stp1/IreP family PP2C-type Ser/Thr phosphatase [Acidobacteriota bacterium]